jgi:hypothetical protein
MKVLLLLTAAAVTGGCRGNFDSVSDAGAADAPPLPQLACSQRSTPLPAISGSVDLAITSDDSSYLATWTDPADGSVTAARFDRGRALVGEPRRLLEGGVEKLAGARITAQRLWMVTTAGTAQTLWSVSADLSAAVATRTEETVASFAPIALGENPVLQPIWARGDRAGAAILFSYLTPAGEVGAIASEPTMGKVTELSFADYDDHVHLGWRTEDGKCYGSDVDFDVLPKRPQQELLSESCQALRVISGPKPHDPLVAVWRSPAGNIGARYRGASIPEGGNDFNITLGSGSAPKIDFDGIAYWVVWNDLAGLRIARIDKAGQMRQALALGYVPVSDDAFELVHRGNLVDLVVRERDKLTFLSLCDAGS